MDLGIIKNIGIHDVIGIGFGPAGIALAAAMEDAQEARPEDEPWHGLFLEQADGPLWQPNMLIPGTDIQHHFLRDFATPRNPRSRFTFPCYLHEKGRLFHFGLLGGAVGRVEWADYVAWVAGKLEHRVRYGHRVDAVEPVRCGDGECELLAVHATELATGAVSTFYTRNLVLCTGRRPSIPPLFRGLQGPRVFHSHHFLSRIAGVDPAAAPSFAVVGSGQNAIEIILYLADHFPSSAITSINRNSGFRIYDLGHFSNQVYFPEEADYFHSLSREGRRRLFEDVRFTNYSSVDFDVSRALYWKVYEDGIQGQERIRVLKRREVREVAEEDGRYRLGLADVYRGTPQRVDADVVILCTGFVEDAVPGLLDAMRPSLAFDGEGELEVDRDYRVRTTEGVRAGIFVNGLTEHTHGISDATSFSMMALKAQRILDRLRELRALAERPLELLAEA